MSAPGNIPRPSPSIPSNAINRLPTSFKPRRRRAQFTPRRSLTTNRRRRQQQDAHQEDEDFSALASMTDTHVAILTLRSQWPQEAARELLNTPPLILRSQIHALVTDPTVINHELEQLMHDSTIRHVRLPSISKDLNDDLRRDAYILSQDFNRESEDRILKTFFTDVFHQCRTNLVEKCDLEAIYGQDSVEEAINSLIQQSYLLMIDENTFTFTVPGIPKFIQHRSQGEKQIIRLLKSSPYREMPLNILELRTLKKTMFTAQWHVRDVIGSGIACTMSTTVGIIVRLQH